MQKTASKVLPEAKYTKFGEKIRHVIPGPMQCSMACGGRNCKWENPSKWSDQDQVIKGVFSSWVLDDVVAMSRPSTEVIQKYDLIKQFKESNICSIINLQRPGEHASCGPPLHKESQFTYEPQIFMSNDIFFYNFGWKDYGVTSLETILDMVKVMAFALSEGKVAVHCHAGLGRTGVLIACFLVYAHRMDASSAINTVRKRRPNSIQTRGQIACIQEFGQFLKPLRIVFPQVVPHAERLTLAQFLYRQRHLLHGFESRELRYIPKIVNIVCQRLVEIATTSQDIGLYDARTRANTGPKVKKKKGTLRRSNTIETLKETLPGAFVNEHLNTNDAVIDLMESQKMDALLSPRVSRRNGSARSKSSSGSKSQSRPESPVSLNFETDILNSREKRKGIPAHASEPILVASVSSSQPFFEDAPQDQNTEKLPGKPQVVLVKQGSRSKLSSAAIIAQPQDISDINLNNNNQIASSITPPPQNEAPMGLTISFKKASPREKVVESQGENELITHYPNLPSPTPSLQEPQISPRAEFKSQEKDAQNAAGDKPPIQNAPLSAGRQQRVIPTGLPAPRIGNSKGLKLLSKVGDNNIGAIGEKEKQVNVDNQETEAEVDATKNGKLEQDDTVGDIDDNKMDEIAPQSPEISKAVNDSKKGRSSGDCLDDSLEYDLDEIIEMSDNGGHFLSGSESEKEDSKSENDVLSKSTASKVSWLENKNSATDIGDKDLLQEDDFSQRAVSVDGRRTPLMHRAGNAQELLADQDSNSIDENSAKFAEDAKQNYFDEDKISDLSTVPAMKTTPKHGKRPKSAGFLKRVAEKDKNDTKLPQLKALNLTQSLCDLRRYDELSRDDFAMMKSGLTPGLFPPLSPGSKSSSSDDVRTPTASATIRRIKDPITVAMALSYKLTDNEWLWEKVYTKQIELNTREGAWSSIEQEVDAHLLSCLMWSWIDHLSEPILTLENVEMLVKESRPDHEKSSSATECPEPALFDKALLKLGKHVSSTLRCVLHCLLCLPPLSFELEASVIKRVTSAFTQSNMQDESSEENADDRKKQEKLVSLIQNYLVKTRARTFKKQSLIEEKSGKDDEALKKKAAISEKSSDAMMHDEANDKLPKADGNNVPSSKVVSELCPRIAVT